MTKRPKSPKPEMARVAGFSRHESTAYVMFVGVFLVAVAVVLLTK